jgi:hypothetical protein
MAKRVLNISLKARNMTRQKKALEKGVRITMCFIYAAMMHAWCSVVPQGFSCNASEVWNTRQYDCIVFVFGGNLQNLFS